MFHLRKLPFDSANNPVVSKETCEYHYGKHHKTYVDNLNNLTKEGEFKDADLYTIIKKSSGGLFNNAAQVYNHDFYWDCIASKTEPTKELSDALKSNFKDFKDEYIKAATSLFGAGWCWLVYNPKDKKLEIIQTSNAQTPVSEDKIPLLVVDVWEHAYYIDDRNARAKYLERFYENIDWGFVSAAYEWAIKEGLGSIKFYIDSIHKQSDPRGCCSC